MKFLIILASTVAIAIAQRPTYAGISSKGYPELASRFRDPDNDPEENTVNNVAVGNRINADDEQLAQNIPTDARGDAVLVNRLNQWPRENRPFWLVNAQHLDQHRHPNGTGIQQQQNLNNNTVQGNQERFDEVQPSLSGNQQILNRNQQGQQQGLNRDQQTFGLDRQQGLNRNQQTFGLDQQQGLNRDQQTFGLDQQQRINPDQQSFGIQQPVIGGSQGGQVQTRFGEPVATETRTIKPLSQRGSFSGARN